MRAHWIEAAGAAPAPREVPEPEPGPGEVRLAVAACALNFADLLMIEGTYQETPPPPFAPGMEVAGIVDALGPGVEGLSTGDRVAAFPGHGGLAERVVVVPERCLRLPEGLDMGVAAAMQVGHGTADLGLERARLARGETLLVLGAAGGVGLAAVELGARCGARVIAQGRSHVRLAAARDAGAEHLVAEGENLLEAVRGFGGADVVFDPVGGALAEAALRALRPLGRHLIVGFASGHVPTFRANHLLVKNVDVLGFYWGAHTRFAPERLRASLERVARGCASGDLKPRIGARLPLERADEGLAMLRERRAVGKVVIEVG